MALGKQQTPESVSVDCWYTASQSSQTDELVWLGQVAEQQMHQGKHFLLYSPEALNFSAAPPWADLIQDDRVQYLTYQRNQLSAQETVRSECDSPQHARLTAPCWELLAISQLQKQF